MYTLTIFLFATSIYLPSNVRSANDNYPYISGFSFRISKGNGILLKDKYTPLKDGERDFVSSFGRELACFWLYIEWLILPVFISKLSVLKEVYMDARLTRGRQG